MRPFVRRPPRREHRLRAFSALADAIRTRVKGGSGLVVAEEGLLAYHGQKYGSRNTRADHASRERMKERPGGPKLHAAGRLAVALPLVCVALIGALWLGQSLRAYRNPAQSPAPSDEVTSGAAAPPAFQQPQQHIDLPTGVATAAVSNIISSPDGTHLIGRTTDFTRLALINVIPERDALILKSEVIATLPDVSFVAWMPDGKSFIAQGTQVLNATPPSGIKPQMKTYEIFRIDLAATKNKIGEALGGPFALSPDAKLLAAFDGEPRLIAIRTDGGGRQAIANDPTAGSAPAFLGWDASGAIVRADYREPFTLRRIPLAGAVTDIRANGIRGASNARWSPDHKAALVTAGFPDCDCDGLLTDAVARMPADALPAWIGPHTLLTRAADEHAGMLDVLTGVHTTLTAKMRSEKIRILAVSLPYVLWLDEAKNVPHLLDVSADRDTGVGFSPAPNRAEPLSNDRVLVWQDGHLVVLDAKAWWQFNVHPTPSPIPQAKDQSGIPVGFVRVESPEGGWSVVIPKTWYRRDAWMHGSELLSYDPQGMDNSGNVAPPGEVRVIIQMPNDYGAADVRAYARDRVSSSMGNKLNAEADLTLAGQPAYTETVFLNNPGPFAQDARFWFVRSPYFSDRVVSIEAIPLAHAAEVDALVQSLRFFKPAPPPVATTTRGEVMARYSKPTPSATRVDRVEAKLVRWKDYEKAVGTFRSGTNDPDELTWIVIVYGEIQPPNRGPMGRATPAPGATPQTFAWEVHAFSATGGEGGMYSCCGPDSAPPAWWDKLVDLAN